MKKFLLLLVVLVVFTSFAWAEDETASPKYAPSWMGLTGLYVVPTARTIGKNVIAGVFSEPKHVEYVPSSTISMRFMDRQIWQTVLYGVTDDLEIYIGRCKTIHDFAWAPVITNEEFTTYGLKYQFVKENGSTPAVSIGIRDIGDNMRDPAPLKGVYNGRKYFLLASKKIGFSKSLNKPLDAHIGFAHTDRQNSLMFGLEVPVAKGVSFIAEGMSDSPFLNFRGGYGQDNLAGRFVYDTGIRFTPDSMPGSVIDFGFVGDGAFEFSFGWGFVKQL